MRYIFRWSVFQPVMFVFKWLEPKKDGFPSSESPILEYHFQVNLPFNFGRVLIQTQKQEVTNSSAQISSNAPFGTSFGGYFLDTKPYNVRTYIRDKNPWKSPYMLHQVWSPQDDKMAPISLKIPEMSKGTSFAFREKMPNRGCLSML